jgi:hypothetical protein
MLIKKRFFFIPDTANNLAIVDGPSSPQSFLIFEGKTGYSLQIPGKAESFPRNNKHSISLIF